MKNGGTGSGVARRRRLVISGGPGSSAPCRSVYRGDGCKGVRVGDMLSYPAPQGRACGRLFVIPGVPGCVVREASCHPRRPSLVCPISPVRGVVQGIRVRIFRVRVFRVQRGLLGVVLLVLCGRRRHASSVVGCRHTFLGMVYVAAHERGRRGWCSVNWVDGCKGVRAGDMLSYPAPQGRACGRHFVIPGVPGCVVREASCHPRRPSLVCLISLVRGVGVRCIGGTGARACVRETCCHTRHPRDVRAGDILSSPASPGVLCGRHRVIPGAPRSFVRYLRSVYFVSSGACLGSFCLCSVVEDAMRRRLRGPGILS